MLSMHSWTVGLTEKSRDDELLRKRLQKKDVEEQVKLFEDAKAKPAKLAADEMGDMSSKIAALRKQLQTVVHFLFTFIYIFIEIFQASQHGKMNV